MRLPLLFVLLCLSLTLAHNAVKAKPAASSGLISCSTCKTIVTSLDSILHGKPTLEEVVKIGTAVCEGLNINRVGPICPSIVATFAPTLFPIIVRVGLDPNAVCSLAQFCGANDTTMTDMTTLLRRTKDNRLGAKKQKRNDVTTGKILHLSDLHWDDLYQAGSIVDCNIPLCCRSDSVLRTGGDPNKKAGKWGDVTCDIPQLTLEALLASAASHNPTMVIITGDNTPHDIWNQTKELTIKREMRAAELLKKYFPNTPVLMSIGNHDSYPVDQFNRIGPDASHLDNFDWLLSTLTTAWTPLLSFGEAPDIARAIADLKNNGYYSVSPVTGLRVVALNTLWGDFFNFYNLLSENQGVQQFEWLEDTLRYARNNREKVILSGHIPTYDSSFNNKGGYIERYHEIFQKNKDIIVGQLYGHTHTDQFNLMYTDGFNATATGLILQTSSAGAFGHQPAFRIIHHNSDFEFLDYEHYITDLQAANQNNSAQWKLEYSARAEYGLKDISPASFDDLWHRFATDDALFQKWHKNAGTQLNQGACDGDCKKSSLCQMVAVVDGQCK